MAFHGLYLAFRQSSDCDLVLRQPGGESDYVACLFVDRTIGHVQRFHGLKLTCLLIAIPLSAVVSLMEGE